jgi:hypothetical protein
VDARCAEHGDVTLLIAAAVGGQEAMVRMLLRRGASVNLQRAHVILCHVTQPRARQNDACDREGQLS